MARSKLEKELKRKLLYRFNGLLILENKRPDWLTSTHGERLELDFYLPNLDLAIEIQGEQHYKFIPYFHQEEQNFTDQLRRDNEKRIICDKAGIDLIEITSYDEIDFVLEKVSLLIPQKETDFVENMKKFDFPEKVMSTSQRLRKTRGVFRERHLKKYKNKLMNYVYTIRKNSQDISRLSGNYESLGKINRLVNNRELCIFGMKRFIKRYRLEIRLGFLLSKDIPQHHKDKLVNQYNSL